MTGNAFLDLVALPVAFGLLGFIEPGVRAGLIGTLGAVAVLVGSAFFSFQKAAWIALGALYATLGVLYLSGKIGWLARSFGPSLERLSSARGAAALGVLFGLNIPACAAPLLIALLGAAAAGGARGGPATQGFLALALFGFALSVPLLAAVLFEPARRALDWLAALSRRLPVWMGLVLVALGAWSMGFGLLVPAPLER